jgi:hypothetical protein
MEVDTTLSPKYGIIQEGHCQPGTDPTTRISQTEQKLAMRNHPWGFQRSNLKIRLARLGMLILSKDANTQQGLLGIRVYFSHN